MSYVFRLAALSHQVSASVKAARPFRLAEVRIRAGARVRHRGVVLAAGVEVDATETGAGLLVDAAAESAEGRGAPVPPVPVPVSLTPPDGVKEQLPPSTNAGNIATRTLVEFIEISSR